MSPQEINELRINVKQLLAARDLDLYGSRPKLVTYLNEKCGLNVSAQSLSMALSGYRKSEPYVDILSKLKDILSNGEFIHGEETKNN